jgi:hypothetical protein
MKDTSLLFTVALEKLSSKKSKTSCDECNQIFWGGGGEPAALAAGFGHSTRQLTLHPAANAPPGS